MGDLFECTIDAAMMRLAREYARRADLNLRGISREEALLGALPVALYSDSNGATYRRTLDDLKRCLAELKAHAKVKAPKVDTRTLALF